MDQILFVGRAAFVAAKSVVLVQEQKAFALKKQNHDQVLALFMSTQF